MSNGQTDKNTAPSDADNAGKPGDTEERGASQYQGWHLKREHDQREELVRISKIDSLTGLPSPYSFYEAALDLISSHPAGYYTLAAIDVDEFKVVNDQYGREIGDQLIMNISCVISECVNGEGLCSRIYADNFAAIYPSSEKIDFQKAYLDCPSGDWMGMRQIRLSVGRYVVNDLSVSVEAMYDRACIAKRTIKGKYGMDNADYDQAMLDTLLLEQRIVAQSLKALNDGEFEAWLQPQYDHGTKSLIGAEVLVRWRHPTRGLVSPGVFIPIFEKNGFIYELDKFIWESALKLLRRWLDEGENVIGLSVNVSRYDILRDDFYETITSLIEKYRVDVRLLRLEITESAFAKATGALISRIKLLKRYGFTIEIDDFGSGYSSFNTLKDVPADILKIDMLFLEKGENAHRGGSILEAIVRMSKWLGMSVIAEGVETEAQADYLKSIGCSHIQGYYYAKPMPVAEFERHTRSRDVSKVGKPVKTVAGLDKFAFWNPESIDTLIFSSYVGGACVLEYSKNGLELIRVNDKYLEAIRTGFSVDQVIAFDPMSTMSDSDKRGLIGSIAKSAADGEPFNGTLRINMYFDTPPHVEYLRYSARVIARNENSFLIYTLIENMTEQTLAEQKERENAEQLRFLNEASSDLLSSSDSPVAIKNVLTKILKYFDGDRAYVFEFDWARGLASNTYEACAEGINSAVELLKALPIALFDKWFEVLSHSDHYRIDDSKNLDDSRKTERELLTKQNVTSLVAVALRRDDRLTGLMGVDNPRRNIAHIDHLEALGDYIAVTLTQRDLKRKIENDYHSLLGLLKNLPCGYCRLKAYGSGEYRIEFVNDKLCEMVGMTSEEIIYAFKAGKLLSSEDTDMLKNMVLDADGEYEISNLKRSIRHKDGRCINVLENMSARRNERGDILINIVFTDISGLPDGGMPFDKRPR